MVDRGDLSLDIAMYIQGGDGKRILVPVRPGPPAQGGVPTVADPEPKPEPTHIYITNSSNPLTCR